MACPPTYAFGFWLIVFPAMSVLVLTAALSMAASGILWLCTVRARAVGVRAVSHVLVGGKRFLGSAGIRSFELFDGK